MQSGFSSLENDVKYFLGNIETFNVEKYPEVLECDVRETEISKLIKTLKRRKAPGMDLVQNEHIIYDGQVINRYLLMLFNKIFSSEVVHSSWKYSIIVPLYIGGGKPKTDPSSYRPISLMPCIAKLFEGLIRSRCTSYLKKQNFVFPCKQQQGFQEQLSCNTAAFNLQETVCYNIEHRSKT